MWLILLEMLIALGLGVFIVWWTMFHRPKNLERPSDASASPTTHHSSHASDPPPTP